MATAFKKKIHGLTNKTVAKCLERSKILIKWHLGDDIFISGQQMIVVHAAAFQHAK
jgi:hypothetical protein